MKTYAPLSSLKAALGIPSESEARDVELALALVTATRWVDIKVGAGASDDAWTGFADDFDPEDDLELEEGVPAAYVLATIAAAVRFAKSKDVPFGMAGMSDQGMVAYVRQSIPEAEVILYGHRADWGIG